MKHSARIVEHYQRKGLRGELLLKALSRHARMLQPLDPGVAEGVWEFRVRKKNRDESRARRLGGE